jgi:salicylate hydroxylase
LSRYGIGSHILEKRRTASEAGAGIQIGPNGWHILAELGVAEALTTLVGRPDGIVVRDGTSAKPIAQLPLGAWIAARHGAPYCVAHRADLHQALLQRARTTPGITLTDDAELETATPAADGRLRLSGRGCDGIQSEVVIGADGLWSTVSRSVFGPATPRFTGRCAARAVLPAADLPADLRTNDTGVWLAPGAHVVHYPVRAGAEIALVVIYPAPSPGVDWGTPLEPALLLQRLAGLPRPFHRLLISLLERVPHWTSWGLVEVPPLPSYVRGRVALVGDAAHPMLPFLAQGGVMALEDAVVLARQLAASPDDQPSALLAYDRLRRPRVARVVATARRNGQIYHLDGVAARARNLALAAVPGTRVMTGYDWLYGWRAAL